MFDDSLSACKGARAAKMRVVGVYDGFFAQDEAAMRGFCDVYIRSFEELLLPPRAGTPPMSGLPEALETAREAERCSPPRSFPRKTPRGWTAPGLDFRDCRFQSCHLRNCDFTGAAFYGCTFTGCLLENCRLSATYWKDCRLSGCKGRRGPAPLPGGRTAFWRRLCFVMSTFPAASGSVFR